MEFFVAFVQMNLALFRSFGADGSHHLARTKDHVCLIFFIACVSFLGGGATYGSSFSTRLSLSYCLLRSDW